MTATERDINIRIKVKDDGTVVFKSIGESGARALGEIDRAGARANATMHTMGGLVSSVAAGLAAWKIRGVFLDGIQAVESYTMAVGKTAALITSLQGRVDGMDLATQYAGAKEYATALVAKLEEIDAQTIAGGKDLAVISQEMLKQGVLLDLNNTKQIEGFVNLANAATVFSNGMEVQLRQEVRALLQGKVDASSQLASQLDAVLHGQLREMTEEWRQQGTLVENLGNLLRGYKPFADELANSWEANKTTLETTVNQILRAGFLPIMVDLVSHARGLNAYLREHRDMISGDIMSGWGKVKHGLDDITVMAKTVAPVIRAIGPTVLEIAAGVWAVNAAQLAFNASVRANPYVMAFMGGFALGEGIKGMINSTGESLSAAKQIEGVVAQIRQERQILREMHADEKAYRPESFRAQERAIADLQAKLLLLDKAAAKEDELREANRKRVNTPQMNKDPLADKLKELEGLREVYEKQYQQRIAKDKEFAGAQKSAWASLFSDLKGEGSGYFDYQTGQINRQADEWRKLGLSVVQVEQWKTAELKKLNAEYQTWLLGGMELYGPAQREELEKLKGQLRAAGKEMALYQDWTNAAPVTAPNFNEAWNDQTHGGRDLLAGQIQSYADDMAALKGKAKTTAVAMKDAFTGWGNDFARTMTDAVWTADFSFGKIGESFGRMITQMVLQKKVVEPIFAAMDSGGAFSWLANLIPNALGGVYDGPGISAFSNTIVNRPTVFAFASGTAMMGEAGPEGILPLMRGPGGRLGVTMYGGASQPQSVRVVIENKGSEKKVASAVPSFNGNEWVISVMLEDLAESGPYSRALRGGM